MLGCYLAAIANVANKGQCRIFWHGFYFLHGATVHWLGCFQRRQLPLFAAAHIDQDHTIVVEPGFQVGYAHLVNRLGCLGNIDGQAFALHGCYPVDDHATRTLSGGQVE